MSMPAEQLHSSASLCDLLRGFADASNLPILGVASDSRQVADGFLFLACQGVDSHGLDYVEQAVAAGAAAVAWDASTASEPHGVGVPLIAVENLGEHLGEIANRFYGNPSAALSVIGVTGTNGKTTVAWMVAQCLQTLGRRCGYVGTLGYGLDEVRGAEGMTTPAAVELHGRMSGFLDSGATHVALEVSSHALSQNRVDGVSFAAVMFTNLSRDHLDYHGDMQSYFESKARLFLNAGAKAKLISLDSGFGMQLAALCGPDVVTVSTQADRVANGRRYVFVRSVVASANGSDIAFSSSWGDGIFTLALPGDFNVANAALVLAYLLNDGVAVERCCEALAGVSAPPGRMQRVAGKGAAIYVDYAHTPDALESALRALRPHCDGELWCVFGCGGDRDRGKRSQMGTLAERLADNVVITNDNPRSEQPQKIIREVLSGFTRPEQVATIADRGAAIAWAINQADARDVILIAGKGHESYQQVGATRLPFSDYSTALAALNATEGDA